MRAPLCLFLIVVACNHSSNHSADAGPATADVSGRLWDQPCQPVAGAQVSVAGGGASVATDGNGQFMLSAVPEGAALEVHAPGHAPSLTTRRDLGETPLLVAVSDDILNLAYILAGQIPDDTQGTVAIGIGDGNLLPVAGATMLLTPASGAPLTPSYVTLTDTSFRFSGSSTDARTGAAVFFNVPPGEYRLDITSPTLSFTSVGVPVQAGFLTADVVTASGNATPLVLSGTLGGWEHLGEVSPPSPTPVPATITLTSQPDGQTVTATTAADGTWALTIPFAFRTIDLTADGPGYATFRDGFECLTPASVSQPRQFQLFDPNIERQQLFTALHGQPPAMDKGQVLVDIAFTNQYPLPDQVTVTLDPPVVAADYGTANLPWPDSCAVLASCAAPSDCPAGSRCEGNECLQGTAPYCSRCGANYACGAGQAELFSGAADCFCVTAVDSCLDASCPDQSDCYVRASYSNESGQYQQVCMPWREQLASAIGARANFGNVPPGVYSVHGHAPGVQFLDQQVRVSAGVFTVTALYWASPTPSPSPSP